MIEPRRNTSTPKRCVQLPGDARELIVSTFREAFHDELADYEIDVHAWIYAEELLLSIGIVRGGEIRQKNFVASIDYDRKKDLAMKIIHTSVDAIASMMDQYFEADGDIEMPLQWQDFDLEGETVHLKLDPTNMLIESQANELLGENIIDLDNTEMTEEEAQQIVSDFKAALESLGESLDEELHTQSSQTSSSKTPKNFH